MASVFFKLGDGFKSPLSEINKLGRGQESKFACNLPCIQQKAQVCGRDTGGFIESLFFNIVRNKVVVALASELVKVAPDAQSVGQHEGLIRSAQQMSRFTWRPVEPRSE